MVLIQINYLAVLVAAIASMVIGALWFSPVLFGNLWMKLSNISKADIEKAKQKGMAKSYFWAFISTLVMAYVLANLINFTGSDTFAEGIRLGFWLWLGFIATVSLGRVLWEGKSFKLWILDNAHNLIAIIVMSAILVTWP